MTEPPDSICILRLSAIGDVCHAVATVQAIQRHYPQAKISWIVGKVEAPLVADLPGIEIVIFDKALGLRAYPTLRRALIRRFDVLLHMQLSLRANLAALCVRAGRRLGFPRHLSRELHGMAVNERVAMPRQPHVLEGFQAFAAAIGVPAFEPAWNIPIPDAARRWAAGVAPADRRLFIIAAGASKPERSWLAERYAAIADHAVQRGFTVVLTGGPNAWEQVLAKRIAELCVEEPINVVGRSTLKELLALLARASLLLAPDSGPAHMAVTQRVPVIGLYAHSNPARTGPWLYQNYVVEVYHDRFATQHGAATTDKRWGTRVKGSELMADIGVEPVRAMFDRVLAEQGLAHG